MSPFFRFTLLSGMVLSLSPLAACTTASRDIEPLPSLTTQFMQPYYLNVGTVIVEAKYEPMAHPSDVSGIFPTPPDLALKTYAENRFKPAGGQGTLRFVIEDATVTKEDLESTNSLARWINVDNRDRYTATIKIGLYQEGEGGFGTYGTSGLQLKTERTLTIADRISLDERDRLLQGFMSTLLEDVDRSTISALGDTMKLYTTEPVSSSGLYPIDPVDITTQYPVIETTPIQ